MLNSDQESGDSPPASPKHIGDLLAAQGYLATSETATAVFLAVRMNRPLLVEGPAGTGKTALATSLANAMTARLIRLQCHEAVDESRACTSGTTASSC